MAILQNRPNRRNPALGQVDPNVIDQAADNLQPPVVPTTNARMPSPGQGPIGGQSKAPRPSPTGLNFVGASGIPAANYMDATEKKARDGSAGNVIGMTESAQGSGEFFDAATDKVKDKLLPAAPPTQEELYTKALNDLLGSGPRDTASEEEQLRNQMLADVGSGQANLNARMGASGFGTSGASSALSTDMRSRAALDAAGAIQGVRKDARDEYLDKVSAGLGFAGQDRGLDITEANQQAYIDALNEIFGGPSAEEKQAKAEDLTRRGKAGKAGTTDEELDSYSGQELRDAGWTQQSSGVDMGGIYYIWVSPDGRTHKEYEDFK